MVQRRDCLESSVKDDALIEPVFEALHFAWLTLEERTAGV
jgi:hypothetical protein